MTAVKDDRPQYPIGPLSREEWVDLSYEDKKIYETLCKLVADDFDFVAAVKATSTGVLSRKTVLSLFGFDFDKELEAMKKESQSHKKEQ